MEFSVSKRQSASVSWCWLQLLESEVVLEPTLKPAWFSISVLHAQGITVCCSMNASVVDRSLPSIALNSILFLNTRVCLYLKSGCVAFTMLISAVTVSDHCFSRKQVNEVFYSAFHLLCMVCDSLPKERLFQVGCRLCGRTCRSSYAVEHLARISTSDAAAGQLPSKHLPSGHWGLLAPMLQFAILLA